MHPQLYQKSFTVIEAHLDEHKHVNNVVYIEWVNKVCFDHWYRKASKELIETYFWVMLDHNIQYKRQAVLDDEITIKTYAVNDRNLKAVRTTEIYIEDKLAANSVTTWALIKRSTMRPSRLPEEIVKLF